MNTLRSTCLLAFRSAAATAFWLIVALGRVSPATAQAKLATSRQVDVTGEWASVGS